MKSLPVFAFLLLVAACGPHDDPCTKPKPCPEGELLHLCECRPYQGGGNGFSIAAPAPVTPAPVTPAPAPEKPKPAEPPKHEHPKHHDHKGKWHGDKPTGKRAGGEDA